LPFNGGERPPLKGNLQCRAMLDIVSQFFFYKNLRTFCPSVIKDLAFFTVIIGLFYSSVIIVLDNFIYNYRIMD
ncbi:MAG: hypothetical protein Q8761_03200, partial [Sweet potato little leaf phytoplasma]|nr:hypothetical protein [Sweet potato little leaf phytoplasma]